MDPKNTAINKTFYILGTVITFTAYSDTDDTMNGIVNNSMDNALGIAAERIMEIDDRMSVYKSGSDIFRINESAGAAYQNVTNDTWNVIKRAIEYAAMSGGALDPTVRPLTSLWGINDSAGRMQEVKHLSASEYRSLSTQADTNSRVPVYKRLSTQADTNSRVPEDEMIEKALELVDYRDILLDESSRSVMLRHKRQALDLGSIAKGYAADEAAKVLRALGVRNAMLNLGGNVLAIGNRPDGRKWHVGIQDPSRMRGEYMAITAASDRSVVTSAGYERHFWDGRRRYHHIIDPSTGYPADKHILSATVIAPLSIDADALSTCIYVMGIRKGMEFIIRLKSKGMDLEAVIITEDGIVHTTPGIRLDNGFSLVGKQYYYYEGETAQ